MKRLLVPQLFLSFSLLMLMAACTKESQTNLANEANYVNTTDSGYVGVIYYNLNLKQPDPGSNFQWNFGYANVSALAFDVTYQVGNSFRRTSYGAPVAKCINFFQPTSPGSVKIPARSMDNVSFAMTFVPAQSQTSYAFYLSGAYVKVNTLPYSPITSIPLRVIINEPVEMNSVWIALRQTYKINYFATIELSMDKLMSGINTNMMNAATLTNGSIEISSTSNQNLYAIILNNLQGNNMNVHFWVPEKITINPVKE